MKYSPISIQAWLRDATASLKANDIGTARLDALVLMEDCLGADRARLLAEPARELSAAQVAKLTKLLNRRALHEPLAYIRGFTEFYGRNFVITPAVLEPRPESETMIELLKQLVIPATEPESRAKNTVYSAKHMRIADVGTGSGALGITAKLELPGAEIDLLDIDPAALKVAKTNVDKFTLKMNVILNDLLANSSQDYDILLCNLPYVPDDYQINQAAGQEPKIAIFGGPDGLDLYRKLFSEVKNYKKRPLFILTESLPPQHDTLQGIAEQHGYKLQQTEDFIQVFTPN